MKSKITRACASASFVLALAAGALALTTPTLARPALAKPAPGPSEVKLGSPEQALKICQHAGVGQWDLSYVAGKGGLAQWGRGYKCKQAPVTNSGVGSAIRFDGYTGALASPQEALEFCKSGKMGQSDIAYIVGRDGLAQWGPGYLCKQASAPPDTSVSNAILK